MQNQKLPAFAKTVARLIASSLLLVFPSCAIPGARSAAPAPEMPPEYSAAISPELVLQQVSYGTEFIPLPKINEEAGPERLPPPGPPGAAGPERLPPANPGAGLPPAGTPWVHGPENSAQLGIGEFFRDPLLLGLIDQAMTSNRELLVLNEEVEIARNEIRARQGAYLPFVTFGARADLDKRSLFTPEGALDDQIEYLPGRNFPDPVPDFLGSFNLFWRLDIWRELRNARDAAGQRYLAAAERRNYFVTRMIADVAENYFELMALDKRLENLDQTIRLQEQSLEISRLKKEAGRGNELAVQRFDAEVRKNQSEKLIVNQDTIEAENRINFLVNRFPQPVERFSAGFYDLRFPVLRVGMPAQLLANRPDIRQAERELAAAGLDVQVARARFFPTVDISAGIGYEAFDPHYLFWTPESLVYGVAGDLVAPLINKRAIQADYMSANAAQLQAIYNYQRVVLDAFTQVVNRVSKAENYNRSVEIKKQQLLALEASVENANRLFQNPRVEERVEYLEVLLAQRDMRDARMVLIDTKREQLSAIVNAYQALGGGDLLRNTDGGPPLSHH